MNTDFGAADWRDKHEVLDAQKALMSAGFELADAVRKVRLKGQDPTAQQAALYADLIKELAALGEKLKQLDTDAETIFDRARAIERMKVYLLPNDELLPLAEAVVTEMRQWGVPDTVIEAQVQILKAQTPPARDEFRPALAQIIDNYDYWDQYTDWFLNEMRGTLLGLVVLCIASLLGSYVLLRNGQLWLGFLCAGAAGTCTSIALKLPQLSVFGEVASFGLRTGGRFIAGIAAAAIGFGLLTSGLFDINLKNTSPGQIAIQADAPALPTSALKADAAAAPSAGKTETPLVSVAVMLALGMLFGFTERALATFEQIVFPDAKT